MNRKSTSNFLEYFSKPLSSEQILYLNNINKVIGEKTELYADFIISLAHIVNDTYLGDDVIVKNEDRVSHFNWCWDKNIKNFQDENIRFTRNGEHYYYFLSYFTEVYYADLDKSSKIFENRVLNFWIDAFAFSSSKTKAEYDLFIDVYKMLDKYLHNDLD